MALATYLDLKQSMAGWLVRTDLDTRIPDFISLFEAWVRRDLRVTDMVTTGTPITFTAGTTSMPLPDGFLKAIRFQTDRDMSPNLEYVTPDQVTELFGGDRRGPASKFTIIGNQIYVGPVTDADITVTPIYYAFSALSGDASSNWLLTAHPDAYLYGSLLHSAPYLYDDQRVETWGSLFKAAMDAISLADTGKKTGDGPLRARSGRADGRC